MDRNRVFELAREAHAGSLRPGEGLWHDKCQRGEIYEFCHRFAALIEREVRGDAEPVGYMNPYQRLVEKDVYRFSTMPSSEWDVPLYTHPAPAVMRRPLTEEQIGLLTTNQKWSHVEAPVLFEFARAVEMAHGIEGFE